MAGRSSPRPYAPCWMRSANGSRRSGSGPLRMRTTRRSSPNSKQPARPGDGAHAEAGLQPDGHGAAYQPRAGTAAEGSTRRHDRHGRRRCQPGVRPGHGQARRPGCASRGPALPPHRAEAATVVNNNAAAVLLVLNSLALRRGRRRQPGRTDRDRRRLPHAGHHGPGGAQAGRGRHHQPDPSLRTMKRRSGPASR